MRRQPETASAAFVCLGDSGGKATGATRHKMGGKHLFVVWAS
jgi:hypothetical protein